MTVLRRTLKYRDLYVLMIPGIVYFVMFRYMPMGGLIIAFKDYNVFQGIWKSEWVGFDNFRMIFDSVDFWNVLGNTVKIGFLKIVFGFPAPIILALLLNEIRAPLFKRFTQSVLYLPHFISWTIIGSIVLSVFSPNSGVFPAFVEWLTGERINILTNEHTFIALLIASDIWKDMGWGTIVYLAAITQVDPHLYEASTLDGANRWQQTIRITIPSIASVIVLMLILRIGWLMDAGFEQIMVMQNPIVREVSDIFDTYVYRVGLGMGEYSFTATVDLFKSVVSLMMIVAADRFSKLIKEEGIL